MYLPYIILRHRDKLSLRLVQIFPRRNTEHVLMGIVYPLQSQKSH